MNVYSKRRWVGRSTVVTQTGNVEGAAENNGISAADAIIGTWTLYSTKEEDGVPMKMEITPGIRMTFPNKFNNGRLKSFSVNYEGES